MSSVHKKMTADELAVVVWFSELTMVNQFAAGLDPSGWAKLQATGDKVDMREEFERRAKIWQKYVREIGNEGE